MKLRPSILAALALSSVTLPEVLGQPSAAATDSLVVLGQRLFFDTALSADHAVSCGTCHRPELAFSDGRARSVGVAGRAGTRNAPSLIGVGHAQSLNWDGRVRALEQQVLDPFVTPTEHGLASNDELLAKVSAQSGYRPLFEAAFQEKRWPPGTAELTSALAAYVRSLDREHPRRVLDDAGAGTPTDVIGPAENRTARGRALFFGAAGCGTCHVADATGAPGSDNDFHAIGIGLGAVGPELGTAIEAVEKATPDTLNALVLGDLAVSQLGRYVVTRRLQDIGRFRTPSLRNVAVTAPYFHDGSVESLEAAVEREIYYRRDPRATPLALSHEDHEDLVAYLRTLVDEHHVPTRN